MKQVVLTASRFRMYLYGVEPHLHPCIYIFVASMWLSLYKSFSPALMFIFSNSAYVVA